MKFDPLFTRFESILERALSSGARDQIEISGLSNTAILPQLLSNPMGSLTAQRPHLVVLADEDACDNFEQSLRFFNPSSEAFRLERFDVSPYSMLYPSSRRVAQRLTWLHRALEAKPGDIFITSLEALSQKTLPVSLFMDSVLTVQVGQELDPELSRALLALGYQSAPRVEDIGQFAIRGGLLDIFSPAHKLPIRVELVGDTVESIRFFDPESQRSEGTESSATLLPCREVLFSDATRERAATRFRESCAERSVDAGETQTLLQDLVFGRYFHGIDFLLSDFYENPSSVLEYFGSPLFVWISDALEVLRHSDQLEGIHQDEFRAAQEQTLCPKVRDLWIPYSEIVFPPKSRKVLLSRILIDGSVDTSESAPSVENELSYRTKSIEQLVPSQLLATNPTEALTQATQKIKEWKAAHYRVFVATHTRSQGERLALQFERAELKSGHGFEDEALWQDWTEAQDADPQLIHLITRPLPESFILQEEKLVFLREENFFGKKPSRSASRSTSTVSERVQQFQFADFNPGDLIVHADHGIGVYEGLKKMQLQGVDAEFIQIRYKDNDRLYVPIYRIAQIQKFSGQAPLDKMGGNAWQKTKIKVKAHLKDIASELLALYAKRAQVHRPSYSQPDHEFSQFEGSFPYDETDDQLRAINDMLSDLAKERPMDRLICGDVGFGKTEVALRAAFKVIQDRRQVALLVPTTILAFQHLETFKNRFKGWPIAIHGLSRFTSREDTKKALEALKTGAADIVIGTHRLLSKDVVFKNLGLFIIDEEQKFGVTHKEKIKKMKVAVDTLTLSATPIPRTLNMSLMGVRDLSIINSAPHDRLPTRTFVCKDDDEIVRKAIVNEVQRGGQVFYIHNRVQSIYEFEARLKQLVPNIRVRVGHGQMDEDALEETMLGFFKHDFDVLLSTTIIESGLDIPNANTMIIDRADTFGLSQLYQLRGRVGRSKERAYCYLMVPKQGVMDPIAQERLKALQENTALGSGLKIAHYDLELRGAGNILGEAQSGFVNAVGYDLYLELLEEALNEAQGKEPELDDIEPEINLKIPALIPDEYMPDIRMRLSFYKTLAGVKGPDDLDRIEEDLRDQFGPPPEQVMNLLGVMLIRRDCKELGIRDVSSGAKTVSLAFTEHTRLPAQKVVDLATRENKKYSITPDNRLIVRMNQITWPAIHEELTYLKRFVGGVG